MQHSLIIRSVSLLGSNVNTKYIKRKSEKLVKISKLANGLSWLIIMLFILAFISEICSIAAYPYELIAISQKRPILHIIGAVLGEIEYLFIGVSIWLILKGISFGLLVLENIERNTGKYIGNVLFINKKENILYKPESVIDYCKLLSKVAIASIILSILTSVAPINHLYEIVRSLFISRPDLLHYSWILTIFLSTLGIGLQSIVYYFSFKSLRMILIKLVNIEVNIRKSSM